MYEVEGYALTPFMCLPLPTHVCSGLFVFKHKERLAYCVFGHGILLAFSWHFPWHSILDGREVCVCVTGCWVEGGS